MKSYKVNKKVSQNELINALKINFPDYSINTHSLNTSIIQVKKGMVMAKVEVISDSIYVLGKINQLNFLYLLIIAIGVTLGGIGAIIAYFVLDAYKSDEYTTLENKIITKIENTYKV